MNCTADVKENYQSDIGSERINFKNYFSEIVKFIIQCFFFLLEMHGKFSIKLIVKWPSCVL